MGVRHYLAGGGLVAAVGMLAPWHYVWRLIEIEALAVGVVVLALLVYRAGRDLLDGAVAAHFERKAERRQEDRTLASWLASHSFPSDTVEEVMDRLGATTLRAINEERWWRQSGYTAALDEEHDRRSEAARRGAARRERMR